MKSRGSIRSLSGLIVCGAVAVSAIGLPHTHDVDHRADVAHVEHDHGGHGTVLLDQNSQLLSKTFSLSCFTVLTGPMSAPSIEPVITVEPFNLSQSLAHPGRDPPGENRPRAPPFLSS